MKTIYKKKDFLELLEHLRSQVENKTGKLLVHAKTTLEDMDVVSSDQVITYLNALQHIYSPLDERAYLKFEINISPFDESLFELQQKWAADAEEELAKKKESKSD